MINAAETGDTQAAMYLAKQWYRLTEPAKLTTDEVLEARHWAEYWLNKATADGNPAPRLYLDFLKQNESVLNNPDEAPKELKDQIEACKQFAKKGDINAIESLAFFLPLEDEQITQWTESLAAKAKNGDIRTKADLAALYIFGHFSSDSLLAEGLEYAREAALAGNVDGMAVYGRALILSLDGLNRTEEGYKWLNKAIDMGHVEAMNTFLLTIRNANERIGNLTPEELAEKEIFVTKKLCERGELEILINEGQRLIETGEAPVSGLQLLERAADMNSFKALDLLALYYYDNRFYVPFNVEKSIGYAERLAQMDSATGYLRLASYYEKGVGVEKDEKKAFSLVKKASSQGLMDAYVQEARMMIKGIGTNTNPHRAFNILTSLKEEISPPVELHFLLGYMFESGLGTQVNYQAAFDEYLLGAEAGDIKAMNNLGLMYEIGVGMPKDISKAKEWYTKSADAGNEESTENLNRLKEKQ